MDPLGVYPSESVTESATQNIDREKNGDLWLLLAATMGIGSVGLKNGG